MIRQEDQFVWVEKYRPSKLDDIVLPKETKKALRGFLEAKDLPHLLFTGSPGTGKTTTALALFRELGCDWIKVNASLSGNIETLRTQIADFASAVSLFGTGRKYVLLDEADYLTHATQPALRGFIEDFSRNCGFIFTCNHKERIIPALLSRLSVVDFSTIRSEDRKDMMLSMMIRASEILTQEGVKHDVKLVGEVVKKLFPDYRAVLNQLQHHSGSGTLSTSVIYSYELSLHELIGFMKKKNFAAVRKWVGENSDKDFTSLITTLELSLRELMDPPSAAQAILHLAKYQAWAALAADQQINTTACLTEIMLDTEWKS